jgi:hypothetical protein
MYPAPRTHPSSTAQASQFSWSLVQSPESSYEKSTVYS